MKIEIKGLFKKSVLVGLIVSVSLLILNSIIRHSFFPEVKFENALIYYLFYVILVILISLLMGWLYYIIKRVEFVKNIIYLILGILILIYIFIILVLLYILNFIISFLRPF